MPLLVFMLAPMLIMEMAPVRSWKPPKIRLRVMGSNWARAGAATESRSAAPTTRPTSLRRAPERFMRLLYSHLPPKHYKTGDGSPHLDALHGMEW